MTTISDPTTRFLSAGIKVVSTLDGEVGTIREVCTFRRSGNGAYSYVVETAEGRDVWYATEMIVPIIE